MKIRLWSTYVQQKDWSLEDCTKICPVNSFTQGKLQKDQHEKLPLLLASALIILVINVMPKNNRESGPKVSASQSFKIS